MKQLSTSYKTAEWISIGVQRCKRSLDSQTPRAKRLSSTERERERERGVIEGRQTNKKAKGEEKEKQAISEAPFLTHHRRESVIHL